MTPQKQRYRGLGAQSGDCHRTCVAMILNMHRDDVPHFMEGLPHDLDAGHELYVAAERAELDWLAQRGLSLINVPYPGQLLLHELLDSLRVLAHDVPFVLGCRGTSGVNHSVVIHRGVVHNPADGDVRGPMSDGNWWLTVYAVGSRWRSPRWRDRLRKLLRLGRIPARVRRQETGSDDD